MIRETIECLLSALAWAGLYIMIFSVPLHFALGLYQS